MKSWQQMRVDSRALWCLLAIAAGGFTFAATAHTSIQALELKPYANLYVLQQGRELDLGFLPNEVHPGYGGEGRDVEIEFRANGLHLTCADGAYRINSASGLLIRADLFCPIEKTVYTEIVEQLLEADFAMTKDFKENARRPHEWGRTVETAFAWLSKEAANGTVRRIPLSRWENQSGLSVSLGAAIYRPAGRKRLMLEIDIAMSMECLFPLMVFAEATPDDDSWDSELIASVRAAYGDTPWNSLPPESRYSRAEDVAKTLCDG